MKNKKYIGSTVIIFGLILGITLYGLGIRIGGKFIIGRLGTVSMIVPLSGISVYIDQSRKVVTSKENELVTIKLSPGIHSVIVSGTGYLPWTKNIEMPSGGTKNISPIFVSQNSSGYIIGQKDPEYWKIKNSITSDKLPSKSSPRVSKDGAVMVWVEGNSIMARSTNLGQATNMIIQPEATIRNVDFYKDRSDTIIFSMNSNVYAIEIDKKSTQNFFPIYVGKSPSFVKVDANSIYVLDENFLMQVAI